MSHSASDQTQTVPSTPPLPQSPPLRIPTLPPSIPRLAPASPPRLQRPGRPSISRPNRPSPLTTPGARYGPRELPKVRRVPSDPPKASEVASRSTALRDRRRIDLTRVIPRSPASPPKTARTALRQLDIPFVSSSTTSTPRGHAMGPGARVDKGKSNPLKRGWAKLPEDILSVVFDHVIQNVMLHPDIGALWGENESRATGLTVRQRNALVTLRRVCKAWRENVDKHGFWLTLPLILDPHEQFAKKLDDNRTSGSKSSTPFQVARELTLSVCLPCRIVAPHLPSSPSVAGNWFHSPAFGIVQACDQHDEDVCCNCLNAGISRTSGPVNGDIMLYQTEWREVNSANQLYRANSLVCAYCRRDTVAMYIRRGLDSAAGSGKRTGSAHESTAMKHAAVQHYVLHSRGRSSSAADRYLAERWIEDMTRVGELRPAAQRLQQLLGNIWDAFWRSDGKDLERPEDRSTRLAVMEELLGEGHANPCRRTEGDLRWMGGTYEDFKSAMLRKQTPVLLQPEYPHQTRGLSNELGMLLIRAALQDLITDRVNFGFWVTPSDEIRAYLSSGKLVHTPFAVIVDSLSRPEWTASYEDPKSALADCEGIMPIGARSYDVVVKDRFLPPAWVLSQLDSMYETTMRAILFYGMRRAVRLCDPKVSAEPTVGEILATLRLQNSWAAGPLAPLPVELGSDQEYPATPISAPPSGLASAKKSEVAQTTWMATPPNSTSPPRAARLPSIEHPPKPNDDIDVDHRLPTPVSPVHQLDAVPRQPQTKKRSSASLHEDLSPVKEEHGPPKRSRLSDLSYVGNDKASDYDDQEDDICRDAVEADHQPREYPCPWIPAPEVNLGLETTILLQRIWQDAREEFLLEVESEYGSEEDQCDCRICARSAYDDDIW